MMSDSHHTYIFCFWQCPLTHAIVYPNWGIILWTSCFHYDSCLCLQTTHFNTTHYSNLHDSRMPGKEKWPSHQPNQGSWLWHDGHCYGFSIPNVWSPPISYLLFYYRSSQPSSSNGKIMIPGSQRAFSCVKRMTRFGHSCDKDLFTSWVAVAPMLYGRGPESPLCKVYWSIRMGDCSPSFLSHRFPLWLHSEASQITVSTTGQCAHT